MTFFLSSRSNSHIGVHVSHQQVTVEANTQNYKNFSEPLSHNCQYFCIYMCFVIGIMWGVRTGLDTECPRNLAGYSSALF